MGGAVYPPCCLPALNYGGSNEDNGNLCLKVPGRHCHTQYPQPCRRPPPTHASPGDSWPLPGLSGSVSCRVTALFSWVLVYKVLFVPSKRLFPQSCVSSGSFMVGLMETSSKRAYAIPRSAAPSAPAPEAGHCWPIPPQETLKHSSVSISRGTLFKCFYEQKENFRTSGYRPFRMLHD